VSGRYRTDTVVFEKSFPFSLLADEKKHVPVDVRIKKELCMDGWMDGWQVVGVCGWLGGFDAGG